MLLNRNKITLKKYRYLKSRSEILGMISDYERAFLQFYTLKIYSGAGEIVDLGTWLGSSTFVLAKGLSENQKVSNKNKRIFAYDLFKWENSLNHHVVNTEYENIFEQGDDYKWLFFKMTKQYEPHIETKGNVLNEGWLDKPIEFLFNDAMKNIETTHQILKTFYPYLMPQKLMLVYQDFDHYLTPWVHLLIFRFRKYFKHIHDIPISGGTVFKLMKELPIDYIHTDVTLIDENEAEQAYKYCLKLACDRKNPNIAAAHVMYYFYHNKFEKAKSIFSEYSKKFNVFNSDLKDVKKLLYPNHD